MSFQNDEEYCPCGRLKAKFNNVNWRRHITTCRIKKAKLNNKSIKSFFSNNSSLLGSGSSSSISISNNVEKIDIALVHNANASNNESVLSDDEVELYNQYNIEQTYKEHISMEIIASNSISDVEQIAMVGVDNANISNNVSVVPGFNVVDKMEKFFAYQKDSRTPCKYGRKCFQTNKNHTDKYKHPPTKNDIKVDGKKITRKRDSKGKVKLSDKTNGDSSNSNHRNNEERSFSGETNDMEVPEHYEQSISTSNREPTSIISISNQQSSTEYAVPSVRQHSQQQQQLLLTNNTLEDCSVDDGIVPCTPTLFTPRRLDGETVSSPHVPSSNQVQRFTFVGESQPSHTPDSNDREQPDPPVQNVTDSDYLRTKISELFLVDEMPKEFYDLWSFCKRQCSTHPEDALLSVGLKLVGPYDVLAGHMNGFNTNDIEKTVLHWRYYYDPPEFQTIIASTDSEFHIGYYRDVPLASPVYVVSNDSSKNCIIQKLGKSLFQALRKHLQSIDSKMANTLQKKLLAYEKRKVTEILEGRKCEPVTKTFHKAGIVVPYDSKTDIGYRPLSESEYNLHKILKSYQEASESKKMEVMDKLQPIINYANIASDECDFGTGFELGIDFFCDGNPDLHRICKQLLVTAYNLLRRPQFATIIKAHLNNRKKGPNMSIL